MFVGRRRGTHAHTHSNSPRARSSTSPVTSENISLQMASRSALSSAASTACGKKRAGEVDVEKKRHPPRAVLQSPLSHPLSSPPTLTQPQLSLHLDAQAVHQAGRRASGRAVNQRAAPVALARGAPVQGACAPPSNNGHVCHVRRGWAGVRAGGEGGHGGREKGEAGVSSQQTAQATARLRSAGIRSGRR